jgi:NAD+ kinase
MEPPAPLLDPSISFPLPRPAFHSDDLLSWPAPDPSAPPVVLLFKKWNDGDAFDAAHSLGRFVKSLGAVVLRMPTESDSRPLPAEEFPIVSLGGGGGAGGGAPLGGVDLVVCVGGDGALLRACALFHRSCPPFIAVGSGGSLGFLTVHTPASARELLARLFHAARSASASPPPTPDASFSPPSFSLGGALPPPMARPAAPAPGTAVTSKRMRLQVDVYRTAKRCGGGEGGGGGGGGGGAAAAEAPPPALLGSFLALNEVLLSRGASPYMAQVDAFVDGLPLTTVLADGLIVATQTGSTAYALSAGGPMLSPNASCISIVPICPHTLSFRPIVFEAAAVIHLVVPACARASVAVTCDGRVCAELGAGDYVVVSASAWPLPLLARHSPTADWLAGIHDKMLWNIRAVGQRKLRSQAAPQSGAS